MMSKDSLEIAFKASNHCDGFVYITVTPQTFKGLNGVKLPVSDWPKKRCQTCGIHKPAVVFLYRGELKGDDYYHLFDGEHCGSYRVDKGQVIKGCIIRQQIQIFRRANGKVYFHIHLRDERGEPYRWFDEKQRRWRAFDRLGVRCMDGETGNKLRMQPYTDRSHDREGNKYASTVGC